MIPFVDLKIQYKNLKSEIDAAIRDCIADANFIKGKAVLDFEIAFAEYLGADFCIGCGNGTDALEIILKALNIGVGDEVIVPALTWISTAEAVSNVGAEPIFVDINDESYTLDYSKIEEKITEKTKAIIPVHLYGCPADMNEILTIATKHNLFVVEDCAQAHGAEYNGKKTGTFGVASAFSFFPGKNLGAYGDAGAITTNNKELADKVREIANHGQLNQKHQHLLIGRNSRLDSIQAAILLAKLKYLDEWNSKRLIAADFYHEKLKGLNEILYTKVNENKKHVFHLFVIECSEREKLIKMFNENHISWGIHYPKPLPFVDPYLYKLHTFKEFPVALKTTSSIFSIPIFPEITISQLNQISDLIIQYASKK